MSKHTQQILDEIRSIAPATHSAAWDAERKAYRDAEAAVGARLEKLGNRLTASVRRRIRRGVQGCVERLTISTSEGWGNGWKANYERGKEISFAPWFRLRIHFTLGDERLEFQSDLDDPTDAATVDRWAQKWIDRILCLASMKGESEAALDAARRER